MTAVLSLRHGKQIATILRLWLELKHILEQFGKSKKDQLPDVCNSVLCVFAPLVWSLTERRLYKIFHYGWLAILKIVLLVSDMNSKKQIIIMKVACLINMFSITGFLSELHCHRDVHWSIVHWTIDGVNHKHHEWRYSDHVRSEL